jgi:hypothetical protein
MRVFTVSGHVLVDLAEREDFRGRPTRALKEWPGVENLGKTCGKLGQQVENLGKTLAEKGKNVEVF